MNTHRNKHGEKTIRFTKSELARMEFIRDLASDIEAVAPDKQTAEFANSAAVGLAGLLAKFSGEVVTITDQQRLPLDGESKILERGVTGEKAA